ncbi:MAG: hypothetical protein HC912_10895 [Saprospiraceae bacterium]|nr:hypothetical protein [Saprospiraceae bacterium]
MAAYDSLRISRIHFIGNRKTKALILHRELDIQEGTWLAQSQMKEILLRERNKIFNTDLFVTVDVRSRPDSSQAAAIEIEFLLKERWYLFRFLFLSWQTATSTSGGATAVPTCAVPTMERAL